MVLSYEQAQEIAVERKFILEIRVEKLGELIDDEKSTKSEIEMIPNDTKNSTSKSSLFRQACYSKPVKKYTNSPLLIGVIKSVSPIELDIQ